jgi:hypothetical protein
MEAFACSEMSFVSEVKSTYKCSRVFDGFAHLLSRSLVSQSASVACCTLCLSLSLRATRRPNGRHGQQLPSFGSFCASTVTCSRGQSASVACCTLCLSMRATVVVPASQYSKTCCGTSQKTAVCIIFALRSSDHLQSSC